MKLTRFSNNPETNETINAILALIGYVSVFIAMMIAIEKGIEELYKFLSPIREKWSTRYDIDEERRQSMGATMFIWACRLHDLPADIINCLRGKALKCLGDEVDETIETRELGDDEVSELRSRFESGEISAVEGWEEAFE